MQTHLEYKDKKSHKFWKIEVTELLKDKYMEYENDYVTKKEYEECGGYKNYKDYQLHNSYPNICLIKKDYIKGKNILKKDIAIFEEKLTCKFPYIIKQKKHKNNRQTFL